MSVITAVKALEDLDLHSGMRIVHVKLSEFYALMVMKVKLKLRTKRSRTQKEPKLQVHMMRLREGGSGSVQEGVYLQKSWVMVQQLLKGGRKLSVVDLQGSFE